MTILHTRNLQVPYPDATELVANGSTNMRGLAQAIDGGPSGPTVTRVIVGTLAGLPQPALNHPFGTIYQCTDAACIFLRSAAATWTYIAVGQSPPPLGSVQFFAGNFDPIDPDGVTRWLICDGRQLGRVAYAPLFAVLGVSFGAGDTSGSFFNIPSGTNNIIVGANTGPGVVRPLGSSDGEAQHTLTTTEMPSHTHIDAGHNHFVGESGVGHQHGPGQLSFLVSSTVTAFSAPPSSGKSVFTAGTFSATGTTGFAGANPTMSPATANIQTAGVSGGSHENRMPYLTVNQIIRVI